MSDTGREKFVETLFCMGRAHCAACRRVTGGRHIRAAWGRLYRLPDGLIDFECPDGRPWTEGKPTGKRAGPGGVRRCEGCGAETTPGEHQEAVLRDRGVI